MLLLFTAVCFNNLSLFAYIPDCVMLSTVTILLAQSLSLVGVEYSCLFAGKAALYCALLLEKSLHGKVKAYRCKKKSE